MSLPAFAMQHASLAGDKLEDVLQLIRTQNVGPVTFFQLIARYGSAAEALRALPELSKRGGRKKPLVAAPRTKIEKEIARTQKFGAKLVMYGEADYPPLLHSIEDPPPVLALHGNAALLKRDAVGMVGARNASAHGCQFAQRLARELVRSQLVVTSGLARGIDSFAHKGALEGGTVGVIAGGIDTIYPPENKPLYKAMAEQGLIISEQPLGQLPFAGSFPGRNRIIAGMSLATVVVEAAPKSGSLITARLAGEYNREVLAVPGSPMDPRSRGCNWLLKQGAMMAESAADVTEAISHLRHAKLGERTAMQYETQPAASSDVEKARALIQKMLGVTPVSVDTLAEQTNMPAAAMMAALLELELAGIIQRHAGGMVTITITEEESEVAYG